LTIYNNSDNKIDPTAIIHPSALIGKGNVIGPYVVIGRKVIIGDNNYIGPHCIVGERAEKRGHLDSGRVQLGCNITLTKQVTIDGGTDAFTIICDGCLLLKNAHVGHDSFIHEEVTLACNSVVGGWCEIGWGSNFGLNSVLHPRSKMGKLTMLAAGAVGKGDLDAYKIYAGVPAKFLKWNLRGMEKAKYSPVQVKQITKP